MDSKSAVRLAVTADVTRGGVVLMVGLGGRLGVLCSGAVIDAGLRGIAVVGVEEAKARIDKINPRIIVAPGTLTRSEREALSAAARNAKAELIELPVVVDMPWIAHAIARALTQRISLRPLATTG